MKIIYGVTLITIGFISSGPASADLAECLQQADDAYEQCKENGGGEVGCQAKKDNIEAQCTCNTTKKPLEE